MGAIYYVLFAFLIVLAIAFVAWVAFGQRRMNKIAVLGIDIGMIVLCMAVLILCIVLRNKHTYMELDPDYVPKESAVTVSGGDNADISSEDAGSDETDGAEESVPESSVEESEAGSAANGEGEGADATASEGAVIGESNEGEGAVIGGGTEGESTADTVIDGSGESESSEGAVIGGDTEGENGSEAGSEVTVIGGSEESTESSTTAAE